MEAELYEEALTIYIKFGDSSGEEQEAFHVAAVECWWTKSPCWTRPRFAERVNLGSVWSKLGKAYLGKDMVNDCVGAFIKAADAETTPWLIAAAEKADNHEDLVPYLKMCRKTIKEQGLDTQLIYSLAKTGKLSELEEIISVPMWRNRRDDERCYDEGMFDAAKIMFQNINNNAKLSMLREAGAVSRGGGLRRQGQQRGHVEGGYFRVSAGRVPPGERVRGLHHRAAGPSGGPAGHYERRALHRADSANGAGPGPGQRHAGVFTELGVLYTKYMPEKLMEHIKIFHGRMNINKILRACEKALMWVETVYLYKEDNQHDAAIKVMVDHASAYQQDLFLDCVQKVRNPEVQYKAISYFLECHPMSAPRLLQVLTPNLDHARTVHLLRKSDGLKIAIDYMKSVQKENLSVVNEALNEIYIEEEDFEELRASIDEFDNFDQIYLAQKVEKHELLEFRRIAAYIYRNNKRFGQSIALSKGDKMFKDAIDTVADSADKALARSCSAFVDIDDKPCFSATCYTCYDLITPDVVVELAWRNGFIDQAMPYMVQYLKMIHGKVMTLDKRTAPVETMRRLLQAATSALPIL